MSPLPLLRLGAVLAVLAAIVDPGCPRARRLRLTVEGADGVDAVAVQRVQTAVGRASASWGEVIAPRDRVRADGQILVGDAGPVAARLTRDAADLAVRPAGDSLAITAISAPAVAGAGTRVEWWVDVEAASGVGDLALVIEDRDSGREEGRATQAIAKSGTTRVRVPWLAVGDGPRALRLRAHRTGPGRSAVRDAYADATIAVDGRGPAVAMLEARPAWGLRFARLALAGTPGLRVSTEVRTAPGLTVRTGADVADHADVLMLGGVDALTPADVARVERAVRERGRTAVLVLDEPAAAGVWRRLWPDDVGRPVSAARVHGVDVGGHLWKVREWLAVPLSTEVRALAYSDTGSPVIAGRGLGAGRVVLVAALDAWRWRADEGVAWATGWQALVRRLAADVPPPLHVTGWSSGEGRRRVVQADIRLRPDVAAGTRVAAAFRTGDTVGTRPFPLWAAGHGRWRGAVPAPTDGPVTVEVTAAAEGSVVPARSVVVDVSAPVAPARWADVERRQRDRGSRATAESDVAAALDAWRQNVGAAAGERWHVTRQWWFAGIVLALLGSEWILRRARRRP